MEENETICAYCNRDVPDEEYVPSSADSEEWERLATWHGASCEWVSTRAHRVFEEAVR